MEGMLKKGTSLTSDSAAVYTVVSLLGAGGQGEVYDVVSDGKHYALKWYFKKMATAAQKEILNNLILKGPPDTTFLWPQDLVRQEDVFGYVMPLRPGNYRSIMDLVKRRAEPSFYALCRAAYKLTSGYDNLHAMGMSYRDISFGNLFFDPLSGDVLICDNDNVAPNGSDTGSVFGTQRFMAPEIVTGKAKPSRNTDLYSLAVLLFYMMMISHPLEGKLEADIKCMDIPAMNRLYGTNPVFIFDPGNKTNRPVKGYQDNALIYWDLYPQSLKSLFLESFTTGLHSPNKRITEKQWLDEFANLMSGIVPCGYCKAEVFYDQEKTHKQVQHLCWNCQKPVAMPVSIVIEKSRVLLNKGAKMYSHHVSGDYDMDTLAGCVVQNPANPQLWGIRNDSKENWTLVKPDGSHKPVAPGKSIAIQKDTKIDFGHKIGEFS